MTRHEHEAMGLHLDASVTLDDPADLGLWIGDLPDQEYAEVLAGITEWRTEENVAQPAYLVIGEAAKVVAAHLHTAGTLDEAVDWMAANTADLPGRVYVGLLVPVARLCDNCLAQGIIGACQVCADRGWVRA